MIDTTNIAIIDVECTADGEILLTQDIRKHRFI